MNTIPILYDDNEILIVNKPYGLAVQGGVGITTTLIDILTQQTEKKIYPVHRLDKDTAGLMVFALSSGAAAKYTQLIAQKTVKKGYKALCFGHPPQSKGQIFLPIELGGKSKAAETFYSLDESTQEFSLISLSLGTGRMHQLRYHLASIGCPILGDDKYGDFKKNKLIRSLHGIKKLQLASVSLAITTAKGFSQFSIDLPEHIKEALKILVLK